MACKNARQNAASKTQLQDIAILQAYCNSLPSCKISINEFAKFNFFYIQHLNSLTVKTFKIYSVFQKRTLGLKGYARAIFKLYLHQNKSFTQIFSTSAEERNICKNFYQTLWETREVFIINNLFFFSLIFFQYRKWTITLEDLIM